MMVNGKVVYSRAGWVTAQFDSTCCLCGSPVVEGAKVIRVAAHVNGGNWAGTCCAAEAEELSGFWEFRPNAPRESR